MNDACRHYSFSNHQNEFDDTVLGMEKNASRGTMKKNDLFCIFFNQSSIIFYFSYKSVFKTKAFEAGSNQ